jgi:pimeloyl-ACP methyl ester carboxylesterase
MHVPRHGLRALAIRLGGALLALSSVAAVTTARTLPASAAPALSWRDCGGGFECSTAPVPLDYDDPQGRTIDIAVIRHPATDPAHRIGSLFFNPGGPGDSGTQALPPYYSYFPASVRARFDVVSFDPRGVGASTAVQCYPSLADEQQALAGTPAAFPVGRAEERTWIRMYADFDRACGSRAADLLPHLSTANVARDMDLLRQEVGDERLSYLGVSYGTYLGATYANLFPGRVRALVLDGNIDPVAAATGYGDQARRLAVTLRFGQDLGMAHTLRAFLDLCGTAAPSACAFSAGSPSATRAKYTELLQRLRAHPVNAGGQTYTYDLTVGLTGEILYAVEPTPGGLPGWESLGAFLQQLWTMSAPATATLVRTSPLPLPAPLPAPGLLTAAETYAGPEQEHAVTCSDFPNPRDPQSYRAQAAYAYARSGAFGLWRTWAMEPCATWPATDADRYAGPWNRPTAAPILLVGNTTDPGTPYPNSVAMAHRLARARLLTVDGYGHTAFLNPSTCADTYETAYLTDGTLPPPDTTCPQDHHPFG